MKKLFLLTLCLSSITILGFSQNTRTTMDILESHTWKYEHQSPLDESPEDGYYHVYKNGKKISFLIRSNGKSRPSFAAPYYLSDTPR